MPHVWLTGASGKVGGEVLRWLLLAAAEADQAKADHEVLRSGGPKKNGPDSAAGERGGPHSFAKKPEGWPSLPPWPAESGAPFPAKEGNEEERTTVDGKSASERHQHQDQHQHQQERDRKSPSSSWWTIHATDIVPLPAELQDLMDQRAEWERERERRWRAELASKSQDGRNDDDVDDEGNHRPSPPTRHARPARPTRRTRFELVDITDWKAVERSMRGWEAESGPVPEQEDDHEDGSEEDEDRDTPVDVPVGIGGICRVPCRYQSGTRSRRTTQTEERPAVDVVIHLGAAPNPIGRDPRDVHATNTLGAYNVLFTAGLLGCTRVVQASSVNATGLVYSSDATRGLAPRVGLRGSWDEMPLTEESACDPEDAYSLSKSLNEHQATSICRLFPQLRIASLRFHLVDEPRLSRMSPRSSPLESSLGHVPDDTFTTTAAATAADVAVATGAPKASSSNNLDAIASCDRHNVTDADTKTTPKSLHISADAIDVSASAASDATDAIEGTPSSDRSSAAVADRSNATNKLDVPEASAATAANRTDATDTPEASALTSTTRKPLTNGPITPAEPHLHQRERSPRSLRSRNSHQHLIDTRGHARDLWSFTSLQSALWAIALGIDPGPAKGSPELVRGSSAMEPERERGSVKKEAGAVSSSNSPPSLLPSDADGDGDGDTGTQSGPTKSGSKGSGDDTLSGTNDTKGTKAVVPTKSTTGWNSGHETFYILSPVLQFASDSLEYLREKEEHVPNPAVTGTEADAGNDNGNNNDNGLKKKTTSEGAFTQLAMHPSDRPFPKRKGRYAPSRVGVGWDPDRVSAKELYEVWYGHQRGKEGGMIRWREGWWSDKDEEEGEGARMQRGFFDVRKAERVLGWRHD